MNNDWLRSRLVWVSNLLPVSRCINPWIRTGNCANERRTNTFAVAFQNHHHFYSRLDSSSAGASGSSKRGTPATNEGSGSRKRKIVESEEISSSYLFDEYSATAAGRSGVEIHSVDPDGKYVRLFNCTDKVGF